MSYNIDALLAPTCFFREIDSDSYKNNKFFITRSNKTYVFENLNKCADPVEVLRDQFKISIKTAINSAKQLGFYPDHIGVIISSILLSSDIYHPV
jgi:hypothetical protein